MEEAVSVDHPTGTGARTTNDLAAGAEVGGSVVQAGSVRGDIHFHQGPRRADPVVPRQLPSPPPYFIGRQAELQALDAGLAEVERDSGIMAISAIGGTAGVGKTALALHWGHRVAGHFTDGSLYVNLRGFAVDETPLTPEEAIRGFLDSFQIPVEMIPAGRDAQVALYRSLLAGRRVLVVLDNAYSAEQVRPLLPGTPGCLAVVTSRNRLGGLVSVEGARPVTLDLMTGAEAVALLSRQLGAERIAQEPKAVDTLVRSSAGLPLALSIIAARAATHPTFALESFADELRVEGDLLDALDIGDPEGCVRTVISWSYRALSAEAARLFGLLGTHPGDLFSRGSAAALAGLPPANAGRLLTELCRAHLLAEQSPGRYHFHDLLRACAVEHGRNDTTGTDHRTAQHRLLDYYLYNSFRADRLLDPPRSPIELVAPLAPVHEEPIPDLRSALAWFTAEHETLVTVTQEAAGTGFDTHAWQLCWALNTYFYWRAHWHDLAVTQEAALAATRTLGDRRAQARIERGLGRAYARLGRYEDSVEYQRRSLTLCEELDDIAGQAATHHALCFALDLLDRCEEALEHARRAVVLTRVLGNKSREARALNDMGRCYARLSRFDEAIHNCQLAVTRFREINDRHGESLTLDTLGFTHTGAGNRAEAIEAYDQAVAAHRELGNDFSEGLALIELGLLHNAGDNPAAGTEAWQRAAQIFATIGHPAAGLHDRVTTLLASPGHSGKSRR